ncbi:hypothetical protein CNEO2_1150003 [Clostridium neonatale]|nr:hypothetical protein CNEO2_1150003 [Clostridium neonatale]
MKTIKKSKKIKFSQISYKFVQTIRLSFLLYLSLRQLVKYRYYKYI